MNKIYIHKGDSTIFANITSFLKFEIETDLDLTNWSAKFKIGSITKEISDISSKYFEVTLSHFETSSLFFGSYFGSIILTDNNGNIKTITNKIPFEVTNEVVENAIQTIDLTVPESSEINISLKIGDDIVNSVNGKTGKVELTASDVHALSDTTEIPDISKLATKEELNKYALKSDIDNLINSIEQLLTEV